MTHEEFIKTYNGKATDYDKACGVQCVDIAKLYCEKVYGVKCGAFGNAKEWYLNYENNSPLKTHFTRIANTPSFVPKKGDIGVFNSDSKNPYGHICICTGVGNTKTFESYDQNYNGKAMNKNTHTYTNFLGVLRFKETAVVKILDNTGYKNGNKNAYALKKLLEIYSVLSEKKLKVMDNNATFGKGTEENVNTILANNGYNENGIAGNNFIELISNYIKENM